MIIAIALLASVSQAQAWLPDVSGVTRQTRAPRIAGSAAVTAALKAPQGVAAVRAAFDRAVGQGMILRFGEPVVRIAGDAWPQNPLDRVAIVPEAAGQAFFRNGRLELAPAGEPSLGLMRQLASHPEDRAAVARDYAADPAVSERLDGDGNGHMMRNWLTNGNPNLPPAKAQSILGRIVLSVLETGCERYPFDQDVAVPRGAGEIGLWHLHPPRVVNGDWLDGDVPGSADGGPTPSDWDRRLGAEAGRNLTLVFRKEGFDAYDVTGQGAALIASYRSPLWAAHFAPALAKLTAP